MYNYIGNATLINNNYVIILFIDCPGATTLYSTRAVCVICVVYTRGPCRTARRRETETRKSFDKAATVTYICIIYNMIRYCVRSIAPYARSRRPDRPPARRRRTPALQGRYVNVYCYYFDNNYITHIGVVMKNGCEERLYEYEKISGMHLCILCVLYFVNGIFIRTGTIYTGFWVFSESPITDIAVSAIEHDTGR